MDKQLQRLLEKLKKQGPNAVPISVLSDKSDISERTIRRRLHQLIELGLVTSQGKNRGVRYALAPHRIAGMGITQSELQHWLLDKRE